MSDPDAKLVGPVMRGVDADLAGAVLEALEMDNPDADIRVDDRAGYIRISMAKRCRLTRASMSDVLGHEFPLAELEPSLAAFAGRMSTTDDEIVWFLERED